MSTGGCATAAGRLYGGSETFQVLASVTAVYEAYNTALTAVMPEYRTLDFVGHHFTTFLLALFGSALATSGPCTRRAPPPPRSARA